MSYVPCKYGIIIIMKIIMHYAKKNFITLYRLNNQRHIFVSSSTIRKSFMSSKYITVK